MPGRSRPYLGTLRTSSETDARLLIRQVWASRVGLVVDRCPTCGKIRIDLDGRQVAIVDTHATAPAHRQVIWSKSFSQIGAHTIRLYVIGHGDRPDVHIDGLAARR